MDEEELKRIHGDDVELAPDDSEDEKLGEREALQQAADQGIYFKDTFHVVKIGQVQATDDEGYGTREEAERDLNRRKDKDEYTIMQTREQLQQDTQIASDNI